MWPKWDQLPSFFFSETFRVLGILPPCLASLLAFPRICVELGYRWRPRRVQETFEKTRQNIGKLHSISAVGFSYPPTGDTII